MVEQKIEKREMKLKFDSKNPYRNLIKNLRRLVLAKTDMEYEFSVLETYAQTQCSTSHIYSHPSIKFFNVDAKTASAKKNQKDFEINPWEEVRTEFLRAMTCDRRERYEIISKSLAWFYYTPRTEDWIS